MGEGWGRGESHKSLGITPHPNPPPQGGREAAAATRGILAPKLHLSRKRRRAAFLLPPHRETTKRPTLAIERRAHFFANRQAVKLAPQDIAGRGKVASSAPGSFRRTASSTMPPGNSAYRLRRPLVAQKLSEFIDCETLGTRKRGAAGSKPRLICLASARLRGKILESLGIAIYMGTGPSAMYASPALGAAS